MHFDYFHPIPLDPADCGGNARVDFVAGSLIGNIPSWNELTYWELSVHVPYNQKPDCLGRSRVIDRTGDRNRGDCWSSVMRADGSVVEGNSYPGLEDFVRQLGFDFGTAAAAVVEVGVAVDYALEEEGPRIPRVLVDAGRPGPA